MTEFQKRALKIAKRSKAEKLKVEPGDDAFGEMHKFRLPNAVGVLYFTITERPWVPMRWEAGFDAEKLGKMFDQRVLEKSLRWDLRGDDAEMLLIELDIRLQALRKYKSKKRMSKAA